MSAQSLYCFAEKCGNIAPHKCSSCGRLCCGDHWDSDAEKCDICAPIVRDMVHQDFDNSLDDDFDDDDLGEDKASDASTSAATNPVLSDQKALAAQAPVELVIGGGGNEGEDDEDDPDLNTAIAASFQTRATSVPAPQDPSADHKLPDEKVPAPPSPTAEPTERNQKAPPKPKSASGITISIASLGDDIDEDDPEDFDEEKAALNAGIEASLRETGGAGATGLSLTASAASADDEQRDIEAALRASVEDPRQSSVLPAQSRVDSDGSLIEWKVPPDPDRKVAEDDQPASLPSAPSVPSGGATALDKLTQLKDSSATGTVSGVKGCRNAQCEACKFWSTQEATAQSFTGKDLQDYLENQSAGAGTCTDGAKTYRLISYKKLPPELRMFLCSATEAANRNALCYSLDAAVAILHTPHWDTDGFLPWVDVVARTPLCTSISALLKVAPDVENNMLQPIADCAHPHVVARRDPPRQAKTVFAKLVTAYRQRRAELKLADDDVDGPDPTHPKYKLHTMPAALEYAVPKLGDKARCILSYETHGIVFTPAPRRPKVLPFLSSHYGADQKVIDASHNPQFLILDFDEDQILGPKSCCEAGKAVVKSFKARIFTPPIARMSTYCWHPERLFANNWILAPKEIDNLYECDTGDVFGRLGVEFLRIFDLEAGKRIKEYTEVIAHLQEDAPEFHIFVRADPTYDMHIAWRASSKKRRHLKIGNMGIPTTYLFYRIFFDKADKTFLVLPKGLVHPLGQSIFNLAMCWDWYKRWRGTQNFHAEGYAGLEYLQMRVAKLNGTAYAKQREAVAKWIASQKKKR